MHGSPKVAAVLAAVLVTAVLACAPRATVRATAPGTHVAVVLDRAIPAQLPQDKQQAQQQLGDWMEQDLVNVLKDAGYDATLATGQAAPRGSYVLAVRFLKYNPGSKAARMFVGFGAGAASLDLHYELRSPAGKVLLSRNDGIGSGVDWRKVARQLNVNMTDQVGTALGGPAVSQR
jgi:hypothetical protein